MQTGWKALRTVALCACVSACGPAPTPPQSQTAPPTKRPFVGKAWVSTDKSGSLGTMRVFLADGTLLMDSCWETYRLARWRALDDKRVEWDEDGARIEAVVVQATDDTLQLELQLETETKNESYRLAQAPFVCPDMPR